MTKTLKIAVVDGQGGGIGKIVVEKLRKAFPDLHIIALGTNATATSQMLKAGATEAATGENAISYTCKKVDIIIGAIGIIVAHSMLGELTPTIATAIAESNALKILIPLNKCNIYIAGTTSEPLPKHIDNAIALVKEEVIIFYKTDF